MYNPDLEIMTPGNLAENRFVDPLSLYLSLIDNEDERVRKELKNSLD